MFRPLGDILTVPSRGIAAHDDFDGYILVNSHCEVMKEG